VDFTGGPGRRDGGGIVRARAGRVQAGVANPFGAVGFLRLVPSGGDTRLEIDRDGGADSWELLITFESTTAANFTAANLGGFASNGAAPSGQTINGVVNITNLEGGVALSISQARFRQFMYYSTVSGANWIAAQ